MLQMKHYWTEMFNYNGNDSRKTFWIGYLGNIAVIIGIYMVYSMILGVVGAILDIAESEVVMLQVVAISTLLMMQLIHWIAGLPAQARRLRDAGFNPYWVIASVVPLLQIVPFIFFFFPTKNTETMTRSVR